MIKVFAFDIDGTLTQHKTPIDEKNYGILKKLSESYTLIAVGAGGCERIHKQLREFPMEIIGNYGMQYSVMDGEKMKTVRDSKVAVADREGIEKTAAELRGKYGFTEYVGEAVEYHASGCITLPLLGTKAAQEDKLAFDPNRARRRAIYREVCEKFSDYNVFVGGSSSFDMAPRPYNKYYALDLWCREKGIDHSEVIFLGDDYGMGGNDESVYRSDFRFITIDDYTTLDEVLAPWLGSDCVDIDGLLGEAKPCSCGMKHGCNIKRVVIRKGALNELPAMTADKKNITLVCDENTERVCGEKVKELLGDRIGGEICFADDPVIPNEQAVERLRSAVCEGCELILGVGSGVINDLCKYVSCELGLPYYIVATAPSMDGYASKGAAMLFGGMKITTSANVPEAIIADTDVLKDAPIQMIKAGYGDIIGKYSCLNDWRLSREVNGELLCESVYSLTYRTVEAVAKTGEKIAARDADAIAELMRALVTVGIAMAYMGNSRPASGSEHHLSHFFEVTGLLRGEPYLCHGIDVAYSTYVTALLRRRLIELNTPCKKEFNKAEWEKEIHRVYGDNAGGDTAKGIIELQEKLGWIYEDKTEVYRDKWEKIRRILADSPTPEQVEQMLCRAGLSLKEFYDVYSEEKLCDAVRYAKDLKDRYTVLWTYSRILTSDK